MSGVLIVSTFVQPSTTQRLIKSCTPFLAHSTVWGAHDLLGKYYPLGLDDKKAQKLWKDWYGFLEHGCLHGPNCKVGHVTHCSEFVSAHDLL